MREKLDELRKRYESYKGIIERYFNDRKHRKYIWFYKGALTAIDALSEPQE